MIPRIIRTPNELAALDPDTLVTAELPNKHSRRKHDHQ